MGSFCVFSNFSHQLSFGGSRGLKPTVLSKTYKGWHLLHQSVIILCVFMFFVIPVSPNHLQQKGNAGGKRVQPISGNQFSCRLRVWRLVIDFFDGKIDRSQFFTASLKLHSMPGTHAFVQLSCNLIIFMNCYPPVHLICRERGASFPDTD